MNQPPLPEEFVRRVQNRRSHDWELLLESLNDKTRTWALRVNTLKVPVPYFLQQMQLTLHPVPWCETGFYFSSGARLGLHPYHLAGLYYIQDPTAMYAVEALDVSAGDKVLDLCASPGGKSTQIAVKLNHRGFLLSNELIGSRVNALIHNLERFGAVNFAVTACASDTLAEQLPDYFDRILIDAPCSGEGLFRKEPRSRLQWHPRHPKGLAKTQLTLLQAGAAMLRPGGKMVYSTCTFAEEENEWVVDDFLATNSDFTSLPLSAEHGIETTCSGYAKLLPHRLAGEGHFCALLQKSGRPAADSAVARMTPSYPKGLNLHAWQAFAAEFLAPLTDSPRLHEHAARLYLLPESAPELRQLNLVRPGLLLGRFAGKTFVPEHSLALSTMPTELPQLNYSPEDTELAAYLRGEALIAPNGGRNSWLSVACDGYTLGLGKQSDGRINNHLPKGLRLLG